MTDKFSMQYEDRIQNLLHINNTNINVTNTTESDYKTENNGAVLERRVSIDW